MRAADSMDHMEAVAAAAAWRWCGGENASLFRGENISSKNISRKTLSEVFLTIDETSLPWDEIEIAVCTVGWCLLHAISTGGWPWLQAMSILVAMVD